MKKIKVDYFKPFGIGFLQGILHDNIIDNFVELAEEIKTQKKRRWNNQLVGNIDNEWKIPELLYKDFKLDTYLDKLYETYVKCYLRDMMNLDMAASGVKSNAVFKVEVERGDGWVNYMKETEYNPIHFHSNCSLSSIYYLNDIEDYADERIGLIDGNTEPVHSNEDGYTVFLNKSAPNGMVRSERLEDKKGGGFLTSIIEKTHYPVKPRRGHFYIFPHWLLHSVNPFKGSEERISASINYGVKIIQTTGKSVTM
jgi:hypothetical protein